jgi:hypothetical protein
MRVPKRNNKKNKKIGAHSLTHSTSGVGRRAKIPKWDYDKLTSESLKTSSTCITKKRGRLMQVEWMWCSELSRNNLKHKLYLACNLWEEAPHPSLYYIMCLSTRMTSKCHFSLRFPSGSGSPKIKTFVVPKLWTFLFFSNQVCFENARAISYSPKKDILNGV